MTRRGTRLFFVVGTLSGGDLRGLTIDSHLKFGELTHADAITPEVIAGKHVWHGRTASTATRCSARAPTMRRT